MADCQLLIMGKRPLLKSLSGTVRRLDESLKNKLIDIRENLRELKPTSLPATILPTSRYTKGDPIDDSEIIGFDGYKMEMVDMLLKSGHDGFIGIRIHGMYGTGKTKLVKCVLQVRRFVTSTEGDLNCREKGWKDLKINERVLTLSW